jgi:NADH dehydrogenase
MAIPLPKRIAIVGGGFAGVDTARALRKRLPPGWEIILYSAENHLVFTPLLAEVIGATINPLHVVWPIREMARGVACRTALVTKLDFKKNQLTYKGAHGELEEGRYDHLVLALGLPVRMDMIPGMEANAWPLKTLGDAFALRNHIIAQLERAEVERDPVHKARLLSFAVIGGGFTGVEIAGAMMDLLRESCKYYQKICRSELRVTIFDGGEHVLGPLRESLAHTAQKRLKEAGIHIRCKTHAGEITAHGVRLADDEFVDAGTVVCAIGNGINPLVTKSELPLERTRICVEPDMRVEGFHNVWAIGDCAAVKNAHDDSVSPTLAQFAIRQAKQLSNNILAVINSRPTRPFSYVPEGVFANLGNRSAVGEAFGIRFSGFTAWLIWHGIYWAKMPSLTRKLQIGFEWITAMFFPPDLVELTTLQTKQEQKN